MNIEVRTKSHIVIAAMIDLALRERCGPVKLAGISKRLNTSITLLEQVFSKLLHKKIVKSTRGPGGGYQLLRKPEEISVADIFHAINEPICPIRLTRVEKKTNALKKQEEVIVHNIWNDLNEKMDDYLSSISLQDLVKKEEK